MKHTLSIVALAAAVVCLSTTPAAAQGHSEGHGATAAAGSMGGGHDHDTNASGSTSSNAAGQHNAGELLTQNKQLSSKLSSLLPAGTDLQQAAAGYRNLGQFVAAVHVSHNLRIPFDSLKCTELAQTQYCPKGVAVPSKPSSLGQAIHTLKPDMSATDSKSAAKEAEKQASSDIHTATS
jgi:hypothetical protein